MTPREFNLGNRVHGEFDLLPKLRSALPHSKQAMAPTPDLWRIRVSVPDRAQGPKPAGCQLIVGTQNCFQRRAKEKSPSPTQQAQIDPPLQPSHKARARERDQLLQLRQASSFSSASAKALALVL